MKFQIVVFSICAVAIWQVLAFSSDERHRIFLTVAKHCKLQENATDADVEEMLKYEAPTTEEGSCLRACLFEMFGMLSNDTLVEEAINSLSAASIDDAGLAEASKNTTEECVSKVTGLKRCELVRKYIECSIAGLSDRGYDLKEIYGV